MRPLVSALIAAAGLGASPQASDETLLTGFEEEDLKRLVAAFKLERKEGQDKEGRPFVSIGKPFLLNPYWTILRGKASQGENALGLNPIHDPEKLSFSTPVKIPSEAAFYYGLTSSGRVFNTCGVFRRFFPFDWSGHSLLRVDVNCDEIKQTVRVALEDEEIGPPVVRSFAVEPGKWVTVEMDLEEAARARGLDLKRMTTMTVGVVPGEAKPKKSHSTLIDNLRLARRGAPAALPVVRDASPHDLPDYYRATSKPEPERIPGEPFDHSPLPPEGPIVISTEKTSVVNPVGWIAARDNNRLLVGYMEKNSVPPAKVMMLQTQDGGKSWKGLDGGANPSSFVIVGSDHGGGRGDVVGGRGDVVVLTNLGCRGGSWASLRLFAQKVTFTGKGWELREAPTLVDCDLRHCNSNQSIVRARDGRLWAAYGLAGRLGAIAINVRYSDDDGITWKSWAEGKAGALPGLEKPALEGWTYNFEEPCLVPFGKSVACLWLEFSGPHNGKLRWSRFENGGWTAPETVEQPKPVPGNPVSRPPINAVGVRGEEIYLVSARWPGVLHYRGGNWALEAPDVPRGGKVAVAGDAKVVVVAPVPESGDPYKGPVALRAWRRTPQGAWSGPQELGREEVPLSNRQAGHAYSYRPGFVVQPYSPPRFVPVAWTCESQKWIKIVRLPADLPAGK
jgi:hypothetical protein